MEKQIDTWIVVNPRSKQTLYKHYSKEFCIEKASNLANQYHIPYIVIKENRELSNTEKLILTVTISSCISISFYILLTNLSIT